MDIRLAALRLALAAGAAAGGSGCTRTYDGTIVPAYEARYDANGALPRLTFEQTDINPPNRRYKFPPPPSGPAETVAEIHRKPGTRLQRRQSRPVAEAQAQGASGGLRCHNETSPAGRVRVVCE